LGSCNGLTKYKGRPTGDKSKVINPKKELEKINWRSGKNNWAYPNWAYMIIKVQLS